MIDLIVIAPSEEITQHTPIGFTLLDQVFTEAGLKHKVSEQGSTAEKLRRKLIFLRRRYPHRIRAQWVEPMSLRGLYLKFRYRLRNYPIILIHVQGQVSTLTGDEIDQLVDQVEFLMSKPFNR